MIYNLIAKLAQICDFQLLLYNNINIKKNTI